MRTDEMLKYFNKLEHLKEVYPYKIVTKMRVPAKLNTFMLARKNKYYL